MPRWSLQGRIHGVSAFKRLTVARPLLYTISAFGNEQTQSNTTGNQSEA